MPERCALQGPARDSDVLPLHACPHDEGKRMSTILDPREVAETLGVTTWQLAEFLRENAAEVMKEAAGILKRPNWYLDDDAAEQMSSIDELVAKAKNLTLSAIECERCDAEDNPLEDEDDLSPAKGTD